MLLSRSPGSQGLGGFNFPSGRTCLPSYIAREPVTSRNLPPPHCGSCAVPLSAPRDQPSGCKRSIFSCSAALQSALRRDSNAPFLRKHLTGFRMLESAERSAAFFGPIIFLFAVFFFPIMPSLFPVPPLPAPPLARSGLWVHLGVSP